MKIEATTPEEYIGQLPEDRQVVISLLRNVIQKNLPNGFEECINYGMIGYVVPKTLFPKGYHCDPKLPLPFMNIASQKKHCGFLSHGHLRKSKSPRLVCF